MHVTSAFRSERGASTPCTVSTIIPAYNARAFIERALQSALAQKIPNSEIIVVDDGSTDGTRELVASFATQGVRLVCHENRGGASAARNTGVAIARGEYVAFLDADDEWMPEKLDKQLALISTNPGMTIVSCRANLFDENGRDTGDIYRGATPARGSNAWRTLLAYPSIATPSVLARRSAICAVGGFNRWLPVGEDQDMWIKLGLLGDVGYIDHTLVHVHSTPNSLSKSAMQAQADYVMPMVISYVERHRDKLSKKEAHNILSERYARIGQVAYATGEWTFGCMTLMRAVRYGRNPVGVVLYMLRASALARFVKRVIHALRK